MSAIFSSFLNCLQGLVKILALQISIGLNQTFLQNAILRLKIKTNIRSLPVKESSTSGTLYLYYYLIYHEPKLFNTFHDINNPV